MCQQIHLVNHLLLSQGWGRRHSLGGAPRPAPAAPPCTPSSLPAQQSCKLAAGSGKTGTAVNCSCCQTLQTVCRDSCACSGNVTTDMPGRFVPFTARFAQSCAPFAAFGSAAGGFAFAIAATRQETLCVFQVPTSTSCSDAMLEQLDINSKQLDDTLCMDRFQPASSIRLH